VCLWYLFVFDLYNIQVDFYTNLFKIYAVGMVTNGHFYFSVIFWNVWKQCKLCSEKWNFCCVFYAVPTCINCRSFFGSFLKIVTVEFLKILQKVMQRGWSKMDIFIFRNFCDWPECRFFGIFLQTMQWGWSQMDIVDSVDKPLTTTAWRIFTGGWPFIYSRFCHQLC
jgi:hypothetical protein